MAELILTEEEKATELWSDLDNEALGRLLRKKIIALNDQAKQMDRAFQLSASMILCCMAAENDATEVTQKLNGLTQHGHEFGDWVVTVRKEST